MIAFPEVASAIQRLIGDARPRITPITRGGNSHIFRVDTDSRSYALKQYPREKNSVRQRQRTEAAALVFLAEHGMEDVPRYYASCDDFALYSWMEGSAIVTPGQDDIVQAAAMLIRLQAHSAHAGAEKFVPAYEACMGLESLLQQLEARYERLSACTANEGEASQFVRGELRSEISAMSQRALQRYGRVGLATGALPHDVRRLIHGDYGLHNMLKSPAGLLQLIDFEYFGWDDPIKMIADFAFHPGTPLTSEHRLLFLETVGRLMSVDAHLQWRLEALLPLFAIRWACITLNSFMPEYWSGERVKPVGAAWEERKEQQLVKATFLVRICRKEGFA